MTERYFVKDSNPSWSEAYTLEEWVIEQMRFKRYKEVLDTLSKFMNLLPEKKEYYRNLLTQFDEQREDKK